MKKDATQSGRIQLFSKTVSMSFNVNTLSMSMLLATAIEGFGPRKCRND